MDSPSIPLPFDQWQASPSWGPTLPMDPSRTREPRPVDAFGAFVRPTPVSDPFLLSVSESLCTQLGIDPQVLRERAFALALSGNVALQGQDPFATNYGGHQFGNWADQLGDGRAISIAELVNANGERQELQLKGAGLTPFSRFADGRAVLRSSVREFVASETMHVLGVPTTRALWLAGTGDAVLRDAQYNGHPAPESGAIVCRVAPSWIRFGHFELPAARGQTQRVRQLADFCIARDFPQLSSVTSDITRYGDWFAQVCTRTAHMIAMWQAVGFVHAVMNTDNMSILGLTIDYGPFGFMDQYDPDWTPNTTDRATRRYRFEQQPAVGFWNLQRLAMALQSLFGEDIEPLRAGLQAYEQAFVREDLRLQSAKLGLTGYPVDVIRGFSTLMKSQSLDFRRAHLAVQDRTDLLATSYRAEVSKDAIDAWMTDYVVARGSHAAPFEHNPRLLPHNWLLQELIAQVQSDHDARRESRVLTQFLHALEQPSATPYPPHWAGMRPAGTSPNLSCSS